MGAFRVGLPLSLGLACSEGGGPWVRCLVVLTVWVFRWMWAAGYVPSRAQSSLCTVLGIVCVAFFYSRRGLSFYILFELSLIPTLGLVLLYGYQPEKLRAGGHLLLYTAIRSLPLLLCLIVLPPYFSC